MTPISFPIIFVQFHLLFSENFGNFMHRKNQKTYFMRNNKKLLSLFLLFPMAFFGLRAHACNGKNACSGKKDGSLHGYVTDAVTKKPLPGVIVSALVPGTTNSYKEVLTDSVGYFHFPQLPASPVTVQFDKKGYQLFKRPGVQIREKTTIKLDVEFLPEGVEPEDNEDGDGESSEYPFLRMLQSN